MNGFKTFLLMAALTLLFVFVGSLWGRNGMLIALVLAAGMNFFSYWFSDKIVLAMYRAQEVDAQSAPTLYRLVQRLAARGNMPMPRVYIIPDASPNAFATGRNPSHAAVAATQGLLQVMNEDELEGVIAHELSHVRNRDILISTIAATMAGVFSVLMNMARFTAIFGGGRDDREEGANPLVLLLVSFLAMLGAAMIQMAISRAREYQADASGAELSGNPMGLARALGQLERASQRVPLDANPATAHMFIVSPLHGRGMSLFSTHPPIEERIARLERMAGVA